MTDTIFLVIQVYNLSFLPSPSPLLSTSKSHHKAAKFFPWRTCPLHFLLSIPVALLWFSPTASGLAASKEVLPKLPASCLNRSSRCCLACPHHIQNTWPGMEGTKLPVLFPTILLHSPVFQTKGKMGQLIFSICASSLPHNCASLLMLLLHTLLVLSPPTDTSRSLAVLGKSLSRCYEFSPLNIKTSAYKTPLWFSPHPVLYDSDFSLYQLFLKIAKIGLPWWHSG